MFSEGLRWTLLALSADFDLLLQWPQYLGNELRKKKDTRKVLLWDRAPPGRSSKERPLITDTKHRREKLIHALLCVHVSSFTCIHIVRLGPVSCSAMQTVHKNCASLLYFIAILISLKHVTVQSMMVYNAFTCLG